LLYCFRFENAGNASPNKGHRNAGKRRCGLLRPVLREAYRPPSPDARTILLAALYQHIFDCSATWYSVEACRCLQYSVEKQETMFQLRRRDWIILTAFVVAGAVGYLVYSKWAEEGLRRTEADMKSNFPLRVDQNTTLVDVEYDRTHNTYWYVIDAANQFDAQETARRVQSGVRANADNSSTMKKEGFSYEYHYKTKDGLALTDFKVTTCE
jgi:hypothetical protein